MTTIVSFSVRERQLTLHSHYSSNPPRLSASRIHSDSRPLCVIASQKSQKLALYFSRLLACPHQLRPAKPRHDFSNQHRHFPRREFILISDLCVSLPVTIAKALYFSRLDNFNCMANVLAVVLAASSSAVDFSPFCTSKRWEAPCMSVEIQFVSSCSARLSLVAWQTRHKFFSSNHGQMLR